MRTRGVLAIRPERSRAACWSPSSAASSRPSPRSPRSRSSACTTSRWRSDALVQDRVGAAAQLAAGRALARPAHAARGAAGPGRLAGAHAAAALARRRREIARVASASEARAHDRAGEQPARHGAPPERRGAAATAQWQPLEEVVGSALRRPARRRSPRIRVTVDLPRRPAAGARCDAVLIERVLANLLENAAKYTPPGTPIEIAARVADGRAAR